MKLKHQILQSLLFVCFCSYCNLLQAQNETSLLPEGNYYIAYSEPKFFKNTLAKVKDDIQINLSDPNVMKIIIPNGNSNISIQVTSKEQLSADNIKIFIDNKKLNNDSTKQ